MRNYKFRGKKVDNGEWVVGYFVFHPIKTDGDRLPFITDIETLNMFQVNPETVGQFTGLHDKNGVAVWEGDIIKWYINNLEKVSYVYFDELQAAFWMGKDSITGHLILNDWMRGEYEIIGNIFDNPELLKNANTI